MAQVARGKARCHDVGTGPWFVVSTFSATDHIAKAGAAVLGNTLRPARYPNAALEWSLRCGSGTPCISRRDFEDVSHDMRN